MPTVGSILKFASVDPISGLNSCVNTWHVWLQGAITPTEATNIMACFKTFYDAFKAYRQANSAPTTGTSVVEFPISSWVPPVFDSSGNLVTKGHFTTPPTIVAATPQTASLGTGGPPMPNQLASVVSWRTVLSGKSGRGRTYLGNFGTSAQVGNLIVSGAVTAINNAVTALITAVDAVAVSSGSPQLAVWSPTKGWVYPIITGASDTVWDTMRSRVT